MADHRTLLVPKEVNLSECLQLLIEVNGYFVLFFSLNFSDKMLDMPRSYVSEIQVQKEIISVNYFWLRVTSTRYN